MRVIFIGTPEFALPTFEALLASDHDIVLVVSKQDAEVGRRKTLQSPPVIVRARRAELPTFQPKSLKGDVPRKRLLEAEADVAVVVAYGRMIPDDVLLIPKYGFINLHPSLLPRHRGPSPIQWTLVCGDQQAGVSIMRLDSGMDTGPIYLQKTHEIHAGDTTETMSPRLAELGAKAMVEVLDQIPGLSPTPQDEEAATMSPMLRRNFGKIDWTQQAGRLANRYRGLTPWPGVYSKFRGGRIKIHGLEKVADRPGKEAPGSVLETGDEGIYVRCGGVSVALLTELQREGRRRLPADAFLIGERVVKGELFG